MRMSFAFRERFRGARLNMLNSSTDEKGDSCGGVRLKVPSKGSEPCINLRVIRTIRTVLIERLSQVFRRMSHAAMRAGRSPDEVRLVAVTKTVPAETIREAVDAGLRVFGENKVQEAQRKIASAELCDLSARVEWHLVGHLQRNKAKSAVTLFEMIQTLDSLSLAEEINSRAEEAGKRQRVLVQVKVSEEERKQGVAPSALGTLLDRALRLPHLKLEGLMMMPPYFENPEEARPYFRKLRAIKEAYEREGYPVRELSMGMSHDFEVAIEEGATLVRIGTALFGERSA